MSCRCVPRQVNPLQLSQSWVLRTHRPMTKSTQRSVWQDVPPPGQRSVPPEDCEVGRLAVSTEVASCEEASCSAYVFAYVCVLYVDDADARVAGTTVSVSVDAWTTSDDDERVFVVNGGGGVAGGCAVAGGEGGARVPGGAGGTGD